MSSMSIRAASVCLAALALVATSSAVAGAAPPAAGSEKVGTFSEKITVANGTPTGEPGSVSTADIEPCSFTQNGDYVHISTSDKTGTRPPTASGHGWWVNGDCKTSTATVTVQLQIKVGGKWRDAGSPGVATVRSGGGSSDRASANIQCVSRTTYRWRSWVDVDLVGVADLPNKTYSPEKDVACYA